RFLRRLRRHPRRRAHSPGRVGPAAPGRRANRRRRRARQPHQSRGNRAHLAGNAPRSGPGRRRADARRRPRGHLWRSFLERAHLEPDGSPPHRGPPHRPASRATFLGPSSVFPTAAEPRGLPTPDRRTAFVEPRTGEIAKVAKTYYPGTTGHGVALSPFPPFINGDIH